MRRPGSWRHPSSGRAGCSWTIRYAAGCVCHSIQCQRSLCRCIAAMQLGAHTACTTTVASCPAVPALQLLVEQLAITRQKPGRRTGSLPNLQMIWRQATHLTGKQGLNEAGALRSHMAAGAYRIHAWHAPVHSAADLLTNCMHARLLPLLQVCAGQQRRGRWRRRRHRWSSCVAAWQLQSGTDASWLRSCSSRRQRGSARQRPCVSCRWVWGGLPTIRDARAAAVGWTVEGSARGRRHLPS